MGIALLCSQRQMASLRHSSVAISIAIHVAFHWFTWDLLDNVYEMGSFDSNEQFICFQCSYYFNSTSISKMTYFQHSVKSEIKYILLLVTLIVIISGVLYKDFLLGEKLYIYTDQGRDTLNNYWPFYSYLINAIKSHQLSFWLFQDGLGNNIFSNSNLIFDPFNIILLLFNQQTLPYAFGYIAVLKILLAGLFFYLYISCFDIMPYVRIIGSLLYSFNGYMILWGQHYQSATVVVFLPLLLFSYEQLIKGKSALIKLLFISIVSFYYAFNLYYMYQLSIFLFIYLLFRYIISNKFQFSAYIVKPVYLYILGLGISAVFSFPTIYVYLSSPRIGGVNYDFSLFTPIFFLHTLLSFQDSFLMIFHSLNICVQAMNLRCIQGFFLSC